MRGPDDPPLVSLGQGDYVREYRGRDDEGFGIGLSVTLGTVCGSLAGLVLFLQAIFSDTGSRAAGVDDSAAGTVPAVFADRAPEPVTASATGREQAPPGSRPGVGSPDNH